MKLQSLLATGVVAALVGLTASPSLAQSTTQSTTTTAPFDSSNSWYAAPLAGGTVTLAQSTDQIDALTTSMTLADQGWGGQNPGNGVYLMLTDNGTSLGEFLVGGTSHGSDTYGVPYQFNTVSFDITTPANAADLTAINAELAGIDWSGDPMVDLVLNAQPVGYPGWELHVQTGASLSITSGPVPEPASIVILGASFVGLGWVRRRRT